MRNLLQHKSKIEDNFTVEPSDQMIIFVRNLIEKIRNRVKCKDIQIARKDVYSESLKGIVKDSVKIMREKMYTHIPIIENNRVIGVFDENSVFCYLADSEIACIDDKLKFNDIMNYCSLVDREMEEFIFFKATKYVEELESVFEEYLHKRKRIGIVFLTASGKAEEELLGILTPWDILGAEMSF